VIHYNIAGVLKKLKRDWSGIFEKDGLKDLCSSLGYKWRKRLLPPLQTLELLLLQVLHGNTSITHLRHIAGVNFSASAYCQARARLPIELLNRILERIGKRARREESKNWLGHRTFLIDGSSFSMPDTAELRDHFGYPSGPKEGCGFPMGHLLALFDSGTKMLLKLIPGRLFTHDLAEVLLVHPELRKGDIIVGDRAFCSFAHVATLAQKSIDAVFRMHQTFSTTVRQKKLSALKYLKRLGEGDYLFEWHKPKRAPVWIQQEQFDSLPEKVQIRRFSYIITQRGFRSRHICIFTTLLDPAQYPAADLAKLYGSRWEVETNFRNLKTTMKMDFLRCQTIDSVLKELRAFAILYNLLCLVKTQTPIRENTTIERVSFLDALRWLLHSIYAPNPVVIFLNPARPNRWEPRAIKRRPKQYDRLNKPRNAYKKAA